MEMKAAPTYDLPALFSSQRFMKPNTNIKQSIKTYFKIELHPMTKLWWTVVFEVCQQRSFEQA